MPYTLPFSIGAAPDGGSAVTTVFMMLAVLVTAARVGGWLATRIGQPSVLGELIAGILVGPSLLGLADPSNPYLHLIAEFGVVILLFEIGLHTDLSSLLKVGPAAVSVGLVGVVLPFGLGYATATWFGLETLPALICGAAMTATSIGISARVLGDLGKLKSLEGRTVIGAAVLDDVMGLIILAVISTIAAGGLITSVGVAKTAGAAIGFLIVALLIGQVIAPRLFAAIERVALTGTTGSLALAFALALAGGAQLAGSAPIIGAFAAGLILHQTPQRETIEEATNMLGHFFVPIFFATVGASVDIVAMVDPVSLKLGALLLLLGVGAKFVAGYAPFWVTMRHAVVGAAMVPRGEVGLIFAQMGLATGALTPQLFGAVMIMVIGTTFVTPPWLAWLSGTTRKAMLANAISDDMDGLDDLVSGERARTGTHPVRRGDD